MAKENYKVFIQFNSLKNCYTAESPEHEEIQTEGETRLEALSSFEKAIQQKFINQDSKEKHFEDNSLKEQEINYELPFSFPISISLKKELAWLSNKEGVSIETLMIELLSGGISNRQKHKNQHRIHTKSNPSSIDYNEEQPTSNENVIKRKNGNREYGNRHSSGGYRDLIQNKANFIQYLRGVENSAGKNGKEEKNWDKNSGKRFNQKNKHYHQKKDFGRKQKRTQSTQDSSAQINSEKKQEQVVESGQSFISKEEKKSE